MRWLVVAGACVVAVGAYLLGGLVMSSAANAAARTDLLVGRALWAFAAAVLALVAYAAATGSPVALRALAWVVVGAGAALGLLLAVVYLRSR